MYMMRTPALLRRSAPIAVAVMCTLAIAAQNPLAHVDVKTVKSYDGQTALTRPDRVVVYDFAISPDIVKTDRTPGVRQRMKGNSKEDVSQQVQDQITSDLVKNLQKRLQSSGIPVEKGTPDMQVTGNALAVRGTITKLDQGHRMRRATVGLGAGASEVETDCQISLESGANTVLVSEFSTVAKSSKKPGAAVTMGAGAAPAVAAGATGATAHKNTAQGDSSRTGSALAKHVADLMKKQGWIPAESENASPETQAKQ